MVGLLVALAVAGGLIRGVVVSNADLSTAATVFCEVFVQAVLFLVLGVVVRGAVATFVSPQRSARWLPRRTGAIVAAGLAMRRYRAASASRCRWRAGCSARVPRAPRR